MLYYILPVQLHKLHPNYILRKRRLQQSCRLSLPLQLAYLLPYFDRGQREVTEGHAYVIASTISASTVVMALLHHPFLFGMQRLAMRTRISLCSMIYNKVGIMNRP